MFTGKNNGSFYIYRRLHIESDDKSEYWEGGEDIAGEYGADGSKWMWTGIKRIDEEWIERH